MLWSFEKVQALILEAEERGESEIDLESEYEAQLFRYAIINYKKNKKLGSGFTTIVRGINVKIRKRPALNLKSKAQT